MRLKTERNKISAKLLNRAQILAQNKKYQLDFLSCSITSQHVIVYYNAYQLG